jgi:nucleotide-binding universal stress UspA family protein
LLCLSAQQGASVALSYSTDAIEDRLGQQKKILEGYGFAVETRIENGSAKREINRIAVQEEYSLIVVGSKGHSFLADTLLGSVASEVLLTMVKPVLVIRLEAADKTDPACARASRCDLLGNILFPTDFSENADLAFTWVEGLVEYGVRRVRLLHIQDRARIDPHLSSRLEEFNRIDQERLTELSARLNAKRRTDVVLDIRYGSPFSEIMSAVEEDKSNLIVLGSQGRGFIPKLFLGSLSHNLARHAKCSLLIIPLPRMRKAK